MPITKPPPYDPLDHYWFVGGDQTRAFSSKIGDYVPANDPTFQAWLTSGGKPTKIDTEASLGEVLSGVLIRPVATNVLDGYKDALAGNIVAQVIFKVLFNHENRLRACERALNLNGSPADLTPAQARAAVKALM